MLLLLEGYDELPTELHAQKSVFLDIIQGKELPEATVLITSRPGYLYDQCKEHLSQHLELLSSTSEKIHSYLESTCAPSPRSTESSVLAVTRVVDDPVQTTASDSVRAHCTAMPL